MTQHRSSRRLRRRHFLQQAIQWSSLAGLGLCTRVARGGAASSGLEAAEGTVDTTPPLSALQLGSIGMLFHPAELYSCYGLTIRRDSPLDHTLVVGYADDLIGCLPDPNAYRSGEYAALTVPGILDLPPFTPEAGRALTRAALRLLRDVTC